MQLIGVVGGRRTARSIWPKASEPSLSMSAVRNPNMSAPVFDINSTRPLGWHRSWSSPSGGVWVDGILSQNWVWTFNRALNLNNGSFSLASPEAAPPTTLITYCCHNRFRFSNVFEELSEVGEYYVNETELAVYLIAPSASHLPELSVSLLNSPLINFEAGSSNITLTHLNLTVGRSSAIAAHNADHISIENVDISFFGLTGVWLGPNSSVSSAHIHDIGTVGVDTFYSGHPGTLTAGNSAVYNVWLHDWAQWSRVYTPAISLGGVANSVRHCKLDGGPHVGIVLDGNDSRGR